MTIHTRTEEALRQAERLLRDADDAIPLALPGRDRAKAQKRRNAINAACNALHRATRA